ncbi:PRKAR2B [Cordylochernes scorpioides]|uniref:PRKAR2B n=1 Tax=Cordylochernes scorpioides TaxID=51811 RepID=A0ABY6KXX2_9ARAC|nr:PRKAR2B [Cordylochernes scorpioides]
MENRASSSQKEASSQKKKKSCKKKNKSKIVESKNLDQSAHHGGNQRRINVFAEQYNPEEDTTDEKDLPVFPKTTEERKMLKKAFGSIVLFKNLSEDQMEQVLNSMEKKEVQAGDIVIRQGDNGDYFYVIMTGLYDVTTTKPNGKTEKINTFDNGGSFGELALLYNQPRAATVTAVTDGILWAMSRVTFRTIVLKSAYKKRKQYEEFLSKVEILDVLTPYDRSNLCDALTTITYEDGKVIFKEGESANGMYFVEKGQISLEVSSNHEESRNIVKLRNDLQVLSNHEVSRNIVKLRNNLEVSSNHEKSRNIVKLRNDLEVSSNHEKSRNIVKLRNDIEVSSNHEVSRNIVKLRNDIEALSNHGESRNIVKLRNGLQVSSNHEVKRCLKGHRFDDIPSIQRAVTKALTGITPTDYSGAYEAWKTRWQRCVDAQGEFFEEY